MKVNKTCDLCGLPVEVKGFSVHSKDGDKEFCCEGCKGIYLMLHEEEVLASSDIDDTND